MEQPPNDSKPKTDVPDQTEQMQQDESWDAMMSDWQSQPYERADTDKLVRQLTRRTRVAKWMFASNILATAGLLVAWVWFLFDAEANSALTTFCGITGFLSVIYTALEFKIRKATWAMGAADPQQIFNKSLSSAKGALQYTRLWLYSSYIMLPLGNWFVWEVSKTSEKDPIPFYIFVNIFIATLIAIGLVYQKRREKELQNLEAFLTPKD